jgi:hypothetical protein
VRIHSDLKNSDKKVVLGFRERLKNLLFFRALIEVQVALLTLDRIQGLRYGPALP